MAVLRKTQLDLAKIGCSQNTNIYNRKDDAPPTPDFMLCWRAAWSQIEPTVTLALKLADDYDQVADVGNTQTVLRDFDTITEDLSAIRENAISNPNEFWREILNLVNLATSLQSALSSSNRDKLHKAIEGLTKTP
jgi:hypothetical protein